MAEYNLYVLGLEVAFKADAAPEQVERARALLEERFEKLQQHGKAFSREKLLTFLALGLADDLLQAKANLQSVEERLEKLLENISEDTPPY